MGTGNTVPFAQKIMEDYKELTDELNKQFGKQTVFVFGEGSELPHVDRVCSGSFTLDHALCGGYPLGRVTEIYGPAGSGKTTLALHAIKDAQDKGYGTAFIDMENTFDAEYAQALGVDLSKLMISQPECGEDAFTIIETMVKSDLIKVIVVDSVAALTPRAEVEGEFGDAQMGAQGRMMSQAFRKLAHPLSTFNAALIMLNQIRYKFVMFGNPETTTGGNALKFYSSVRVEVRQKTKPIEDADKVAIASDVEAYVTKNKCGMPFRRAHFNILFGKGIDREAEVFDYAVNHGMIIKSGAWFSYNGQKIGQGREKSMVNIAKNGILEKIYEQIKTETAADQKGEQQIFEGSAAEEE